MKTPDQKEALERIKAIDSTLSVHSHAWQDAAPERKSDWWKKIDALLDQRIEERAVRDGILVMG